MRPVGVEHAVEHLALPVEDHRRIVEVAGVVRVVAAVLVGRRQTGVVAGIAAPECSSRRTSSCSTAAYRARPRRCCSSASPSASSASSWWPLRREQARAGGDVELLDQAFAGVGDDVGLVAVRGRGRRCRRSRDRAACARSGRSSAITLFSWCSKPNDSSCVRIGLSWPGFSTSSPAVTEGARKSIAR